MIPELHPGKAPAKVLWKVRNENRYEKRSYVAMMFLVSFIMLLLFSKPAHVATFENKVYYDAAKKCIAEGRFRIRA